MQPIKVKRNPPQKIIHPIPPHTGFGSEEDSLLSVYFLKPKATLKDMEKMFKSDKHVLRFNAKLISSLPADSERKFIVSVFVRDDTIQIFETAEKNSGRISSKFMERQKHKNPYSNKYYAEKDFVVGNTIYINKYIFKLLECDEYTKKYMKDNPENFRDSDVNNVVERIRLAGLKYNSREEFVIDILKTLDPSGNNFVSREEILECLKK
jgi:EF-hand domain-containing protein 1